MHKQIFMRLKEEIFEKLDILNHEDSYFYPMNVENKNMEQFHNILTNDYEGFLLYRANELNDLFHERLYQSYYDFQRILELQRQVDELDKVKRQYQDIRDSFSYRVGYKVTAPIRALGRMIRRQEEDTDE